jgi:hypothetical protein
VDVLYVDDDSVNDKSFTRRRSNRSSRTSQSEGSEEINEPSLLTRATPKDTRGRTSTKNTDLDDAGGLRIPRKNATTPANDKGSESVEKTNSIIQNAELLALTPTKAPPIRGNRERQQQGLNTGMGTPGRNGNEVAVQHRDLKTGNFFNVSSTSELSKEEKLRKFLESQHHQKQGNAAANEVQNFVTNGTSTQSKNRQFVSGAMDDLREICDYFKKHTSNENTDKTVRLHIQLSSKGRVDLFGSFICTDDDTRQLNDRYDFFDTNSQGEIVLSSPPPIFPDEFPDNTPTHSASWWGIVEPTLGIGKYRSHHQAPVQAPISNISRNVVQSNALDKGKDNNKDNNGITVSMNSGNRRERNIYTKDVDIRKRSDCDRFPMSNNNTRNADSHNQRKDPPSIQGIREETSMLKNHGRR